MKKVVVILLSVLLIVGVVAPHEHILKPAFIAEVDIIVDAEAFPPRYCLRVVAGGPTTCWQPWRYHIVRFGSTVLVVVLTLHHPGEICGQAFIWEEILIPLRSCPAMIYTVMVNSVVKTFVVSWFNGIRE